MPLPAYLVEDENFYKTRRIRTRFHSKRINEPARTLQCSATSRRNYQDGVQQHVTPLDPAYVHMRRIRWRRDSSKECEG